MTKELKILQKGEEVKGKKNGRELEHSNEQLALFAKNRDEAANKLNERIKVGEFYWYNILISIIGN